MNDMDLFFFLDAREFKNLDNYRQFSKKNNLISIVTYSNEINTLVIYRKLNEELLECVLVRSYLSTTHLYDDLKSNYDNYLSRLEPTDSAIDTIDDLNEDADHIKEIKPEFGWSLSEESTDFDLEKYNMPDPSALLKWIARLY